MLYTITDYLGSIWALVNEQGQLVEKYAYDPWGRRINPDDWSLMDNRTSFITDRGFTLRVAGYSDYFNDLGEDLQDEIINRTAHGDC